MQDKDYIQIKKAENNVLKKVTPTHTRDWYIKWVSSIILILGMILTSNNIYPLNLVLHIIGIGGWLVVAMMWNDRALMVINSIGIVIYINGILQYYMGS
jgi:hypothetical protein